MCNLQVHSLLLHHSLLGELPACIQHGAGARRAAETYGWLMMMRRKSVGIALAHHARRLTSCCVAFRHRHYLFTCLSHPDPKCFWVKYLCLPYGFLLLSWCLSFTDPLCCFMCSQKSWIETWSPCLGPNRRNSTPVRQVSFWCCQLQKFTAGWKTSCQGLGFFLQWFST